MLVYHGEADPIVPVHASEPLARAPGVTRRTYPGWHHETHNEPGTTVIDDTIAWLRRQAQGATEPVAGRRGSTIDRN
jgi:alpha-beta hydrolase superfamily lysophospholipase